MRNSKLKRFSAFCLSICLMLTSAVMITGCTGTVVFSTNKPVYNDNYGKIITNGSETSGSAEIQYFYYQPLSSSIGGYISSKQCTYSVNGNTISGTVKNVSYGNLKITGRIDSSFSKIVCYKQTYRR